MDLDRENLISEQKDLLIQGSWIPVTPVKAGQENDKLRHENLVRSENFSTGFSRENQEEMIVESYDSTNCFKPKRSVNNWDTGLAVKAPVSVYNAGGKEHTYIDPMAGWNNIPFMDLLTQAARGSNSAQAEFTVPDSAYDFSNNTLIGSRRGQSVSSSSLPQTCDRSLELNQATDGHFRQMARCELPYDLNALPDSIKTDELPSSNSLQLAPITPGKRPNQETHNKNEDTILQVGINDNNQEKIILTSDASFSTISTLVNPEKESDQVIDFSTTPQSKPRKRKHRPRVITESKPRTQKSAAPKPGPSKDDSASKRKYVRKRDPDWTPPPEVAREITDPKPPETKIRSSRRVLNFGSDVQSYACNSVYVNKGSQDQQFWSGKVPTKTTVPVYRGMEGKIVNKRTGIVYDLLCSINKQLTDYRQAASNPHPTNTNDSDHLCEREQINVKHNKHLAPRAAKESCITTASVTGQTIPKKRQCADILGMENSITVNLNEAQYNGLNSYSAFHVQALNSRTMHFPEICKKRRTESTASTAASACTAAKDIVELVRGRLQNDSNASNAKSTANFRIYAPHLQTNRAQITREKTVRVAAMDRVRDFECILALGDKDRLTKKRTKSSTRVRNLASLAGFAERKMLPALPGIQARAEVSHVPQNCIETLVAETRATLARRKRSKTHVLSCTNAVKMGRNNLRYTRRNILSNTKGPPLEFVWKQMLSVDAITERLKHLHINMESNKKKCNAIVPYAARYQSQALVPRQIKKQKENALVPRQIKKQKENALVPRQIKKQKENALVVYGRDGTIVPLDSSFYPIKKRQSRPVVDLDEETNRVWQLLLENINNKGIDGTDEQNEKWWEEERRVFRGRADSFIARGHLVQGDRRFSRWKGSVLDSVVGVFLTQNVSDHLSSSAFMSMASHFPLQSNSNKQQCYQEESNPLVEEPDICILDDMVNAQSSLMLNEIEHTAEKEVCNSSDSFGCSTGSLSSNDAFKGIHDSIKSKLDDLGIYCELSINSTTTQHLDKEAATFLGDRTSKEDVISSQSSVDSSMAKTVKIIPEQCSESNLAVQDPGTRTKQTNSDGSTSFRELFIMAGHNPESMGHYDNRKMDALNLPNWMEHDKQSQNLAITDDPVSSLVSSTMPSSDNHSSLSPTARSVEVDYCKECSEESKTSEISKGKNDQEMIKGDIFRNEATFQAKLSVTTNETEQYLRRLVGELEIVDSLTQGRNSELHQNKLPNFTRDISDVSESTSVFNIQKITERNGVGPNSEEHNYSSVQVLNETNDNKLAAKRKRVGKEKAVDVDWDILRKQAQANGIRERTADTKDSLDWDAVRCADVGEIAHTIRERGMNNKLAGRIKDFLNRLVSEHGSLDLEWLRDVSPDKAKEYLLSIRGLGLKSVECVRLLTLHHLAFPVDTNVGRIAVRLGWVPLQPLPESLQLHLLELYPVLESIQKYLWPRLCKLDQRTLYELHYQMITFGKVFCTKSKPNCNACPMRGECRHFASAFASARLALPAPEEKSVVSATENRVPDKTPATVTARLQLAPSQVNQHPVENNQLQALHASEAIQPLEAKYGFSSNESIIEEPVTPEPECIQITDSDIEDACFEDPDEIPTIKLNMDEFTRNLQEYMQKNMDLQEGDMSRALVALGPEAASVPTPKLKYISRLRTEHQVYELPDSHPLLHGLDKREPDDPCSYLLAIWTPGETTNSIQPPEGTCKSQKIGELCSERTCFSCNSIREANSQIVRGTLLIPCRTAMKGSFPLNGTYFQVNEVFADHDSSLNPIDVPRDWIWNLPRRTVYFGTSIPTIFKGLSTEDIQYCFWRGFVCVRGFDQKSRAPRPLIARLHFPASRLIEKNTKTNELAHSSHP